MLLIGENGIGKRTFINTLCKQNYFGDDSLEDIGLGTTEKVNLDVKTEILNINEPDSIPIKLQFSITKNFGFNIQNYNNSHQIIQFIETIYQTILDQEQKIDRNVNFEDNRIHIGIYFIKPNGKGLNELDIECMKAVSERINLIPVIAKNDSLTIDELKLNKELITNDIKRNKINIYNLHSHGFSEEEDIFLNYLQSKLPFSVISSKLTDENGNFIRKNASGIIQIEDEKVCDIKLLRTVLFGSHLQEFKDVTVNEKYESFRVEQLKKVTAS